LSTELPIQRICQISQNECIEEFSMNLIPMKT
jgi:hypothetical protein